MVETRRMTSNMYRHHTTISVYSARPVNTFHMRACVHGQAISVNDLLILVDGSNVFTVYIYIYMRTPNRISVGVRVRALPLAAPEETSEIL